MVITPGPHMYHTHHIAHKQQMMGLSGGLIIKDPYDSRMDRDYFIMLQEFKVEGLEMGEIKKGLP